MVINMRSSVKKYAALYARVSTDAQREEGYSIDAQKEMLAAYCVSKGIERYEFYVDGGFSGSNIERPEMQRMIEDVKLGKVSAVVVYKLDRLSRSQKDTLFLIEDIFNPTSTGFVSLNENMDTSTPIGRAMLGIMSAFAQLERETIRERTRMGMRERVKSGYWMGGGKPPFGYDYDSEKGILVKNSDAETVKRMYQLYSEGYSMMRIARTVGLKYERLAEQILLRKTNIGSICYNGVEYDGKHEGIITRDEYERFITLYNQRSRQNLTTSENLLAGLIYCGKCGAKMRYQKWGKSGYKIYCYSQDKGKPHLVKDPDCDNIKMWADEIEEIVINDIFKIADKKISFDKKYEEAKSAEAILIGRCEALRSQIKRLYGIFASDGSELLLETIEEKKKELSSAEEHLKKQRECGESEKQKSAAVEKLTDVKNSWEYMTFNEKQNIIRQSIEKIVITDDRADIYYRFDTV